MVPPFSVRVVVVVSSLLFAATAASAPPPASPPEQLLGRGKAALKEERFDDALQLFGDGLALSGDEVTIWQMLLGLALAHELSGDRVQAVSFYQAFVSRSDARPEAAEGRWPARRERAVAQIDELEEGVLATHARLSLETDPPGAKVVIDDVVAQGRVTPTVLYLTPGQHLLELRGDERTPLILAVSVDRSQRIDIQRTLVEATEPTVLPQPVPVPVPSPPRVVEVPAPIPESEASLLAPIGWTLGALGVGGLVVGGGLTASAVSTQRELRDLRAEAFDEAVLARDAELQGSLRNLQAGSAASFAAGGALLVSGILMVLLQPEGPLGPRASAHGVGLGGSF